MPCNDQTERIFFISAVPVCVSVTCDFAWGRKAKSSKCVIVENSRINDGPGSDQVDPRPHHQMTENHVRRNSIIKFLWRESASDG